jgi:hypothetical protein
MLTWFILKDGVSMHGDAYACGGLVVAIIFFQSSYCGLN